MYERHRSSIRGSIENARKIMKNIKILQERGGIPISPYQKYNFFSKDLKERDIFIMKIYKESPLTIWLTGVLTFLVAAFIICGGEIEISAAPPRIRIKMSSLGEGLRKLKEAMRR